VVTGSFDAASLGVKKAYSVWLPSDYATSARRYPVVYLLHGLGGNETTWLTFGKLRETAEAMHLEAIVVMPDADDGCYANAEKADDYETCFTKPPPFAPAEKPETYCVKLPHYEDYLTKDVVGEIDRTYRTIADAKHRALVGAAMGGFGAWMLALRHPDLFGIAASHSGFVALTWAAKHPYVKGSNPLATTLLFWGKDLHEPMRERLRAVFGPDLANYRAHDPAVLAAELTPELAPKLYLDAGLEDPLRVDDEARYVHAVLEKAKVAHEFELVHGQHLFSLWKERLPKSLAFVVRAFAAP
jgi:putative tributyrin esterase